MFDLPKEQLIQVPGMNSKMLSELCQLWNFASKSPFASLNPSDLPSPHPSALDSVYNALIQPEYRIRKIAEPLHLGQKVLVGFSGGKDGVAATIKLKAMGAQPELFHVTGINRAYPDEFKSAQELSERLDLPFWQYSVTIKGSSEHIENPVKNQFILGMMVDLGIDRMINTYCQGNLRCDTKADQNLSSGYSDSIEMYWAFDEYFRKYQPYYRFATLLENDTDSFETLARHDPDLFHLIRSCMSPLRYRAGFKKHNEQKYGVSLMANRCGSCYKCGTEWLHLWAMDVLDGKAPHAFIIHCIDMMVRGLERTYGRKVSREEACDAFMGHYTDMVKGQL